jgi:multimeric flavodoxin WrbA
MIIGISGSATPQGSTDILVEQALKGAGQGEIKTGFFRLNEMNILPCQACGKSPEPAFCFFEDDALMLLENLSKAEAIILGSPIYFDSVSAQTKLFIDRSNCLQPADFSNMGKQSFKGPLFKGKKGGIILVAGAYGKFETSLKVMRAFFIWAGIEIKFELQYTTKTLHYGEAQLDESILAEALECGKKLIK